MAVFQKIGAKRLAIFDILPALKNGDSYRATTRLSGVTSVGSCFYEAA